MLVSSQCGYTLARHPIVKISHILYMDGLKLYAYNKQQLQSQIELAAAFIRAIHMDFGFEKYAFVTLKAGKIQEESSLVLISYSKSSPLPGEEHSKYLGIHQAATESLVKEQFQTAFKKRLKMILNT
ncbi:hypothetical protein HHI36_022284 [Cryptolaemus montrouzieri]|uniref:Uncharacterized protein n=1 Tax=Cryptolaemus montrouzieri TaxID=559131 RepID=A0ABD2MZH9_9CUCU